ncbi:hypothetical protein [Fulvimonas soli]|uniref:hypothetical protein n=1 Tax=Fulvimonas soli TaxID=155197 RepID=UPI0011227442|nr:hypothetical protein [Fulvimonas soli]
MELPQNEAFAHKPPLSMRVHLRRSVDGERALSRRLPCDVLFENASYLVARRMPMRLGAWWSSFYVVSKADGRLVKASGAEKLHLLAALRELKRDGAREGAEAGLLENFAAAVAGRGPATWRTFFRPAAARGRATAPEQVGKRHRSRPA